MSAPTRPADAAVSPVSTRAYRPGKSAGLYTLILLVWSVLFGAAVWTNIAPLAATFASSAVVGVLNAICLAFIGYFWMNGVKDVAYTLAYHLWAKHRTVLPAPGLNTATPNVALLYCTCNDFNAESLRRSMEQDYPAAALRVVILDDSSHPEFRSAVDEFAAAHPGVTVVRRADRVGFKAGNLNNFLRTDSWFDYFVILDSDEIVPPNFVRRTLDYFAGSESVGIVQANHHATRNRNHFMQKFAIGVDSHWPAYQTVKDRFGFLSLLGHGATVSRTCYEKSGGFPHVVAEDLCLSIEARNHHFVTVFAPDVLCEEEYPVSYGAFTVRHNKWTQGNMEFIRNYTGAIFRSRMRWFEKLDIVLFTYSLPLTAFFSVYIVINVMVLPLMGYRTAYPLWMLIPTAMFLFAPMLNDAWFYLGKMPLRRLASYLFGSMLLYGSMFWVSLPASFKSMFGKSHFLVTPKAEEQLTLRQSYRATRRIQLFGAGVALLALFFTGSVLPVLLLLVPALAAPYLQVMHQRQSRTVDAAPAIAAD